MEFEWVIQKEKLTN